MGPLRLATRGSAQATAQSAAVAAALMAAHPGLQVELVKVETLGDQRLDVPLHTIGGQGVFVKEVQRAVLAGDADLAVHSAKDLPSAAAEGLQLAAFCARRDPRDARRGCPRLAARRARTSLGERRRFRHRRHGGHRLGAPARSTARGATRPAVRRAARQHPFASVEAAGGRRAGDGGGRARDPRTHRPHPRGAAGRPVRAGARSGLRGRRVPHRRCRHGCAAGRRRPCSHPRRRHRRARVPGPAGHGLLAALLDGNHGRATVGRDLDHDALRRHALGVDDLLDQRT